MSTTLQQSTTFAVNETHLGFIQDTITRMGQNSFQIKTWAITIDAALLAAFFAIDALNASADRMLCLRIGFVITTLLMALDAYYLYLERGYRELYAIAVGQTPTLDHYSVYDMRIPEKARGIKKYLGCFFSPSILLLYGGIILGNAIMLTTINF